MKNHIRLKSSFSIAFGTAFMCLGLSLIACGDDSSSSGDDSKNRIAEYETMQEMVHCTKSHYGEVAYVVELDSVYECTSEGWVSVDSSKIEELLNSSASESDDKDIKSSDSEKISKSDTAKVKNVKVKSVTVKGVAEKGPFASGGVVTVYGLDSDFNETKQSFKGSVSDDKGSFTISGISLESQYAVIEVKGFFNNEVSGKVTSGSKTKLNALVDLSKGGTVKANVNVFTSLEMSRAVYLVLNEKYNVLAAKKRATREILSVFGVKTDSLVATDISLSGDDDATKALFAASVAMIGNLTTVKFNSRISDFVDSFAATGKMDDTLRAEIADNLNYMDSAGVFAEVAKNVKSINSKISDLDSFLYNFWVDAYGLPVCNDKNEKTQEKNTNKLSDNYGAGFACTSKHWHKSTALDAELGLCVGDAEGSFKKSKDKKYYTCNIGQWREISSTQYELKECTDAIAKDDDKKYRSVNDKQFFLCKDKQWKELSADEFELRDCTKDNAKDVVTTKSKNSYVCESNAWRKASDQEAEFGYCAKVDSTIFKELNDKYYACLKDGWMEVDTVTAEVGFCTSKNKGKFKTLKSGNVFVCDDGEWIESDGKASAIGEICGKDNDGDTASVSKDDFKGNYVCDGGNWTMCGSDNDLSVLVEKKLACENKKWRKASESEISTGMVCGSSTMDSVSAGYVCSKNKDSKYVWREANDGEKATGKVCGATADDGSVVKVSDSKSYTCENNKWRTAKTGEAETGAICTSEKENVVDGTAGFACVLDSDSKYGWRAADAGEKATEKICGVTIDNNNMQKGSDNNMYTCIDDAWRASSAGEVATNKLCDESFANKVNKSGTGFVCEKDANSKYNWRAATTAEMATGDVCGTFKQGGSTVYKNVALVIGDYACDDDTGVYAWRDATSNEKLAGAVCSSSHNAYEVENGYACLSGSWREATAMEIKAGFVCDENFPWGPKFNSHGTETDKYFVCDYNNGGYNLRYATDQEVEFGMCDSNKDGEIWKYSSTGACYKCSNKKWIYYSSSCEE